MNLRIWVEYYKSIGLEFILQTRIYGEGLQIIQMEHTTKKDEATDEAVGTSKSGGHDLFSHFNYFWKVHIF